MIEIHINDADAQRVLQLARQKLSDMTPLMRQLAGDLDYFVQENFAQGGRPKWAGVKRGGTPLVQTGRLKNSITTRHTNNEAIASTNLAYAPYHQFGTAPHVIRAKNKKALSWPGAKHPVKQVNHPGIKARPFMVMASGDEHDLVDTVNRYLASIV